MDYLNIHIYIYIPQTYRGKKEVSMDFDLRIQVLKCPSRSPPTPGLQMPSQPSSHRRPSNASAAARLPAETGRPEDMKSA